MLSIGKVTSQKLYVSENFIALSKSPGPITLQWIWCSMMNEKHFHGLPCILFQGQFLGAGLGNTCKAIRVTALFNLRTTAT